MTAKHCNAWKFEAKTEKNYGRLAYRTAVKYTDDQHNTTRPDRQFVVIAAGGHGTAGTKLGDSLVAYALPE